MTSFEFKEFCETMHKFRVKRLKMHDVEICMDEAAQVSTSSDSIATTVKHNDSFKNPFEQKMEEMKSIVAMNDSELVDRLYPEPTEPNLEA